ncbi:hypothetical protein WIS52_12025 [Pseudonocardia nematodicida]|uniref:Uncharacterized protein n=1 Tax=Pseudonocardia nematodicida TaxID=1206997 RepID=A0ABV1KAC3_9PSEU
MAVPLVAMLLVASLAGCTGPAATPPEPEPASSSTSDPATPVTAPDGVATTDSTGAPLPETVLDTARRIDDALASGDPTPIRDLYSPAGGAATWRVVADRLSDPTNREKLSDALRNPPESRPEIAYLFADGDHGLGVSEVGRLAFVGVGQGGSSSPAPVPDAGTFWVGEFLGHGRSLAVDGSGRGTLTFRTYETCPSSRPGVPCESQGPEDVGRVELQITGSGRSASARVLDSNDEPEVPTGDVLPVETPAPGVVSLGSGDRTFVLCADGVTHLDCGA